MKRRLWAAVLVGLVVAATVGPGMTVTAAEATVLTRTVWVPPAAFIPDTGNSDYLITGAQVDFLSGGGDLVAPVYFEGVNPQVRKIALYAYDDNLFGDVCVEMWRHTPALLSGPMMGEVCSHDAAPALVRIFTQRTLWPRRVAADAYAYVRLELPGTFNDGYSFRGVKVTYTYTP